MRAASASQRCDHGSLTVCSAGDGRRRLATFSSETIAVWGAGPVGLFAMKSARLLGAESVIAIVRFPERLQRAQEFGDAEAAYVEPANMRQHRGLGGASCRPETQGPRQAQPKRALVIADLNVLRGFQIATRAQEWLGGRHAAHEEFGVCRLQC